MNDLAPISVLCVDDNEQIREALRLWFGRHREFSWVDGLESADNLARRAVESCPNIVLLDLDMGGRNPFEVVAELADACPETRVVIFSGHVRLDLVERALEAGAWGYVSKNDGEHCLFDAIRRVARDHEVVLSPQAQGALGGG